MSRRVADPKADRAAQNQQTLKSLLKLEGNKVCADCKRNKHPRWASWNLGVFVCIRCSGIHRGMGTHISRVKSVDLDSWQDDQLQSILKWGNTRANKYWEAKLAAGHQPSEAKIENFIRTKYESKRWVMDGPMPDPVTLDAEGDENVPLNLVQEKAKLERAASQRAGSAPQQQGASQIRRAAQTVAPTSSIDLFGDETPMAPPIRPNTADIPNTRPTRAGPPPATQRPARQGESLLGLDFFGGPPSANAGRPSSAASNPVSSRPDLKQSILSLYAAAPKPQPPPQSTHDRQPSFGGMASPPAGQKDPFGGMTDAFAGLSFPSTTAPKSPPQASPSDFSNLSSMNAFAPKSTPSAPQVTSPPPLSGGNFFDTAPAKTARPQPQNAPKVSSALNGLDFSFAQPSAFTSPTPAVPNTSSDLFASDEFSGFADPSPAPPTAPLPTQVSSPVKATKPAPSTNTNSAFNLSAPAPKPAAAPVPMSTTTTSTNAALFDPWSTGGDSGGWGAPEPTVAPKIPSQPSVDLGKVPSKITPNDISGGWGSPISSSNKPSQAPTVTADEDFGGWTSASTTQTPVARPAKSGGGFTSSTSDPFDNPWG
jgi:stromal membrane-associated protein